MLSIVNCLSIQMKTHRLITSRFPLKFPGALNIHTPQSTNNAKPLNFSTPPKRTMATQTLPKTMKALLQPDPASTKLILTSLPLPIPKVDSTEHLIRIHTAALTNGELLWRHNFPVPASPSAPRIFIPLYDIAGTVLTSPPNSPFPPGSEIYTRTDYTRTGSGSEYTVIRTDELALKPRKLSWAEAATVPMSAMTAWQALFVHAGLAPAEGAAQGKKIFITAASGGVGSWAVQLAKWAGAEVLGTASGSNVEFVKSLGASEVLDYKTADVREWAGKGGNQADVVVDCVGKTSLADAWFVVKEGGTLVSIFQPPEGVRPKEAEGKNVRDLFFVMESKGSQLEVVTKTLDEGTFRANLDSVFPLSKFEEAFEKLASGKTQGKIVLDFGVEE